MEDRQRRLNMQLMGVSSQFFWEAWGGRPGVLSAGGKGGRRGGTRWGDRMARGQSLLQGEPPADMNCVLHLPAGPWSQSGWERGFPGGSPQPQQVRLPG